MAELDCNMTLGELLAPVRSRGIAWGSSVERERRRRVLVAVWAYAYECLAVSMVSDEVYDREAHLVDANIATGNAALDAFFLAEYQPYTGAWVHRHPDVEGLHSYYTRLTTRKG